ncbi:MAG: ABC transporter ATP-binding protein [Erysipelotrichaceae bacterium]
MIIEQLQKNFGDQSIIQSISYTFETNHIYGLVGENGAGKSTFLRLCTGILQPDAGSVMVEGFDVNTTERIKSDIAFVSDDPYFLPGASLATMKDFYQTFYRGFDEATYQELRALFALDEHKKIQKFSKGMKRQVSLILALSIDTKYILLDEAFDGLDPKIRLTLKQYLIQKLHEKELCIIISSHNLRELEDIADTILIMKRGLLQESGSSASLNIYKFQVVFQTPPDTNMLAQLNIVKRITMGKVETLYLSGELDTILEKLEAMQPLLCEQLALSMEERIVQEMEDIA